MLTLTTDTLTVTFKKLLRQDLYACAKLLSQIYAKPPWNEPWDQPSAERRLKYFFEDQNSYGLKAIKDDQIVGFIIGNTEPWLDCNLFQIRECCIEPELQRQGHASRLLTQLYQDLLERNVKAAYLSCHRQSPGYQFFKEQEFNDIREMAFFAKKL